MEEETEYVNGIEVLAGLCDEHGLQHWDSEAMACETHIFVDKAGNPHECWEAPSGMVNVVISMTPEQTVALGTETCKNVAPSYLEFLCSECGFVYYRNDENFYGDNDWHFCPNCGKKVVTQ